MLFDLPNGNLLLSIYFLSIIPALYFIKKNGLKAWPNVLGWLAFIGGLQLIYHQFNSLGPVALMLGVPAVFLGVFFSFYDHPIELEKLRLNAADGKKCSISDQSKDASSSNEHVWLDEEIIEKP